MGLTAAWDGEWTKGSAFFHPRRDCQGCSCGRDLFLTAFVDDLDLMWFFFSTGGVQVFNTVTVVPFLSLRQRVIATQFPPSPLLTIIWRGSSWKGFCVLQRATVGSGWTYIVIMRPARLPLTGPNWRNEAYARGTCLCTSSTPRRGVYC